MAHVTGGGLAANLARVLPDELRATLDRATWQPAADLRRWSARSATSASADLEATLNWASAWSR